MYGVESCKIMFVWGTSYSLVKTLLQKDVSFLEWYRQTDRQMDRQSIMPIAGHTVWQYNQLKITEIMRNNSWNLKPSIS